MTVQWRDAEDNESGCRVVGCVKPLSKLWEVDSDGESGYCSDLVCTKHFSRYLDEFFDLTGGDSFSAHRYRPSPFLSANQIYERSHANMNGPSGDVTHLIGYIKIEEQ